MKDLFKLKTSFLSIINWKNDRNILNIFPEIYYQINRKVKN